MLSIQELERRREFAETPAAKPDLQLYQNAALVEIGVSNPQFIEVEWVK